MTEPAATHATTSTPHRPDRSPHGTPISRATGGLPRSYRAGGGVAVHATAPPPRAAALGTQQDHRGWPRANACARLQRLIAAHRPNDPGAKPAYIAGNAPGSWR